MSGRCARRSHPRIIGLLRRLQSAKCLGDVPPRNNATMARVVKEQAAAAGGWQRRGWEGGRGGGTEGNFATEKWQAGQECPSYVLDSAKDRFCQMPW